jgi:hypothetical protein
MEGKKIMTTQQIPQTIIPPPKTPRRWPKRVGAVVALGAALGIGAAIGSAGNTTKTVAGPTRIVTKTVTVPGPARTVIKDVPGPTKTITKTKTVTVQAPPPAAGAVVTTFHGSGNEATPSFNVPASGNYIVAWTFSGNEDSFGGGGSNFIIDNTGSGAGLGLANDIAVSGHGSSEVTGGSGTDSFNVQAADSASWTLTVTAA